MDWLSWLSKTGLEASLVYEYGQTFAENELEQDDLPYFNHEFLQSMGISIAKHRIEILKLARKHNVALIWRILKTTKRCFSKYLMRKRRNKNRSRSRSRAPLLLTNGGGTPMLFHSARIESFSSPLEHHDDDVVKGDGDHEYDEYWSSAVEEISFLSVPPNIQTHLTLDPSPLLHHSHPSVVTPPATTDSVDGQRFDLFNSTAHAVTSWWMDPLTPLVSVFVLLFF
ncbi:hypothetical protein ACS0TY_035010 [Phlomoides rotata]